MWTGGLLRNNFCTRVLSFFFSSIQIFFTALISLLVLNFQLILFFPSAVKFYPGLLKHCVFEPGNYFQLLGKRFLWVFIYLLRHCFDLSDDVSINAGCTCLSLLYLINRLINTSSVLWIALSESCLRSQIFPSVLNLKMKIWSSEW